MDIPNHSKHFKVTVSVISSDPTCKDGNARFTTVSVPLKALSDLIKYEILLFFRVHCLINGAKTATRKHSFKSSATNGRAKGGKIKRNCGHVQMEKGEKRSTFEIINYASLPFYFTKIMKNKL